MNIESLCPIYYGKHIQFLPQGVSNILFCLCSWLSFLWVRLRLTQRCGVQILKKSTPPPKRKNNWNYFLHRSYTQSFGQGLNGLGQRFRGLRALQLQPPPPPTITISNSVHILKALNGAKGPVQRFRGLRALLKNPFTPPPPKKREGGFTSS